MKAKTFGIPGVVLLMLAAGVARPGTAAVAEELAVVQAIAKLLNVESMTPFDYLYYESRFSARKNVAASLSDPDRTQFCGLTRDEGLAMVREMTFLDMEPVEFDKSTAKVAGLGIGHKQLERFRYIRVSRVVFGPDQTKAWIAADLNGESGAVYRLDKTNGEWSRTARCGGWVKATD
jgi:hypothetical protein